MDNKNNERQLFWKCLLGGFVLGIVMGILIWGGKSGSHMIRDVGYCIIIGTGLGSTIGIIVENYKESKK